METKTVNCSKCGNPNFFTQSDRVIRCQYCGANIFIEHRPGSPQQDQPLQKDQPLYKERPIINLSKDTDVLDSQDENYVLASYGQRFANFVIDRLTVYFMLMFILFTAGVGTANAEFLMLFALLMIPGYYILLEGLNGKTLGKYLTKTKAVNEDGSKLSYGRAFFRTLCRMIPFEFISIFFGDGLCWHDSIPRTRVIKDN
jgi:uncharacterized RDD family membrane protein YckC/DNA-directed RNA polymerase subunit RPC12/RpoP